MPETLTGFEYGKIFTRSTKLELGSKLGGKSSYGVVYRLKKYKNRVVKIFIAPTLSKGRKEVAISINMGVKGISPKVFKAGIVGFKKDDPVFYMIMDRIDGDYGTLKKEYPELYVKYEKNIEEQISRLIMKFHSYDYIHGDLKDNNIGFRLMSSGPPRMYLLDFGFSILSDIPLDTNKKFMKGFVKIYRELDLKVNNIIRQGYEEKIQKQLKMELKYNKDIKRTSKGLITINRILKELKKIQNKPYKSTLVEGIQAGPLRLRMGNRHWLIYDPLNANTLHKKPVRDPQSVILTRIGNGINNNINSNLIKNAYMKKKRNSRK